MNTYVIFTVLISLLTVILHIKRTKTATVRTCVFFHLIYIRHIVTFSFFGHVCFVFSRNPDDDTYKDIYVYVTLIFKRGNKSKKNCGKYKPLASCYLLQEIMSPWATTIAFQQFFVSVKRKLKMNRNILKKTFKKMSDELRLAFCSDFEGRIWCDRSVCFAAKLPRYCPQRLTANCSFKLLTWWRWVCPLRILASTCDQQVQMNLIHIWQ